MNEKMDKFILKTQKIVDEKDFEKLATLYVDMLLDEKLSNKQKDELQAVYIKQCRKIYKF